jgi:DNA-binding NarL/FixJ family response regulator
MSGPEHSQVTLLRPVRDAGPRPAHPPAGAPVRVSVLALDPVLEAGTSSVLRDCPDIGVVTPQEDAAVAVVIVDDVDETAIDVIRASRARARPPEVVVVATRIARAEALRAIAAGVRGLLCRREASAARLTRAVLAAAVGDCTMPPGMLDCLIEDAASARFPALAPSLSERERAVLSMVADGQETDDIARALCYSSRTVTGVVHDITQRYRLRNRAHAVAYALRTGLL